MVLQSVIVIGVRRRRQFVRSTDSQIMLTQSLHQGTNPLLTVYFSFAIKSLEHLATLWIWGRSWWLAPIIKLGPSYTKKFLEILVSRETEISRNYAPILVFLEKKISSFFFSRFLELTSQNNFARLNSRFTYLKFFHPPILVKISQDFLSQGNLEIFCLSR